MKNEIILFEESNVKLEVNVKDDTVWLNRNQIAELFDRDVKTIGKHINNALREELERISNCRKICDSWKRRRKKSSKRYRIL